MALEKATITNSVTGELIPVLFNPEEYTVSRENNFAQVAIPGLRAPLIQFVHGNLQTLEMELLVDTLEQHNDTGGNSVAAGADVRQLTNKIVGLLDIDPTTHAPPVAVFAWGSLTFTCVLARAQQKFIMFLPDGTPVRARLMVTFNEFTNADLEAKEIKRETADYSKRYVVVSGDTVSAIAGRVYSDATMWRPIALRNNIADPRHLTPGTSLLIPALPYRDPNTGRTYP
jgi:nucleoid-associated protein YgaU